MEGNWESVRMTASIMWITPWTLVRSGIITLAPPYVIASKILEIKNFCEYNSALKFNFKDKKCNSLGDTLTSTIAPDMVRMGPVSRPRLYWYPVTMWLRMTSNNFFLSANNDSRNPDGRAANAASVGAKIVSGRTFFFLNN